MNGLLDYFGGRSSQYLVPGTQFWGRLLAAFLFFWAGLGGIRVVRVGRDGASCLALALV
jgi:hypothetical protein